MGYRLALLAACFLLEACSAAILSVGREESSLIDWPDERHQVRAKLGDPVQSVKLDRALSLGSIREKYPASEVVAPFTQPTGADMRDRMPRDIVREETFEWRGRVQRKHVVGEAAALAGYTLFLSEIVMVPLAIHEQVKRDDLLHKVTVWYDSQDRVVAYLWTSY